MSDVNAVTVKILDRDFRVSCTAEEKRRLVDAAELLDGRMREIKGGSRMVGLDRVAVLAALNLAAEFLELKERHANLDTDVGGKIRALNELLAAAQ